MKKVVLGLFIIGSMSSCFIQEHVVGGGGETEAARSKTVYLIGNRIDKVDSKELAGGASDYTIDTRYNFVDMLISGLTFGIVGTRTVIIKK